MLQNYLQKTYMITVSTIDIGAVTLSHRYNISPSCRQSFTYPYHILSSTQLMMFVDYKFAKANIYVSKNLTPRAGQYAKVDGMSLKFIRAAPLSPLDKE